MITIQGIDKFEYKYVNLSLSINSSIKNLNSLGQEGWEVIELVKPKSSGDIYNAWLKRRITVTKI